MQLEQQTEGGPLKGHFSVEHIKISVFNNENHSVSWQLKITHRHIQWTGCHTFNRKEPRNSTRRTERPVRWYSNFSVAHCTSFCLSVRLYACT